MTVNEVPFPPSGSILQAVKQSAHTLRVESHISVDESALKRLLLSPAFIGSFTRVSKSHGLGFPLNFPSALAEINFISILSLLNFGSGYRAPLHKQTGRGAWDTVRAFVFAAYITSTTTGGIILSAEEMKNVRTLQIAELMNINVQVERPHENLPGVTIGELGGPLLELVELMTLTLNETGEALSRMGYPSLGAFILEAFESGRKAGAAHDTGPDVDTILDQIIRGIPGFRDMVLINGKPVYILKKALFLIHAVSIRFKEFPEKSIPIPDTSSLPIFADNVIPSLLSHLGVIDLTGASEGLASVFRADIDVGMLLQVQSDDRLGLLASKPPPDGPILSETQAYILRAAAIDACEMLVDCAHSLANDSAEVHEAGLSVESEALMRQVTLPEVDMWLWAIAKDRSDYRRLERFVLRNTIMF